MATMFLAITTVLVKTTMLAYVSKTVGFVIVIVDVNVNLAINPLDHVFVQYVIVMVVVRTNNVHALLHPTNVIRIYATNVVYQCIHGPCLRWNNTLIVNPQVGYLNLYTDFE